MQKVLIRFQSYALGDTIAWFPYIEEYRKRKELEVIYVSMRWNELFEENYPKIIFNPNINEKEYDNIIDLGIHIHHLQETGLNYPSFTPLQKYASDMLGFEYFTEIRPNIRVKEVYDKSDYINCVSIGTHSTSQAKHWNNSSGWQDVVDYLSVEGYDVYCLDRYRSFGRGDMMNEIPENVIFNSDITIDKIISIMHVSDFFVGLGSGLSWLAWAVGIPVILISGFSHPITEFQSNIGRVFNPDVCNTCFNKEKLDASTWKWCPSTFKKQEMFECTKEITSDSVILEMNKYISKKWYDKQGVRFAV